MRRIGVLAIQGSFLEHIQAFERLKTEHGQEDLEVIEVRCASQLSDSLHALVIPGGESTTMGHFLKKEDFLLKITAWLNSGHKFAWGTCAGLIMLADELHNEKVGGQCRIGGIAINAFRNSYGRQRESCEQKVILKDDRLRQCLSNESTAVQFHLGVFIRAPKIMQVLDASKAKVIAETESGEIVGVWQDRLVATTFHPELTDDLRFHKFFADLLVI